MKTGLASDEKKSFSFAVSKRFAGVERGRTAIYLFVFLVLVQGGVDYVLFKKGDVAQQVTVQRNWYAEETTQQELPAETVSRRTAETVPACTTNLAEAQGRVLSKLMQANFHFSACFDFDIPNLLWKAETSASAPDQSSKPFVFVNVGANKGYVISEFLELFHPELEISPERLATRFETMQVPNFCGYCGDCNREPRPARALNNRTPNIMIHALEPNPQNIKLLEEMYNLSADPHRLHSHFKIHPVAASNKAGTTFFPVTELGSEQGGIIDEASSGTIEVTVTSLSSFVANERIDTIDFLAIDTEGHDPLVLEGSEPLFREGRVRSLMFEYHSVGYWNPASPERRLLSDVVEQMETYGLACFLLGSMQSTVQLSKCWTAIFEFNLWSNVLCLQENHPAMPDVITASITTLIS